MLIIHVRCKWRHAFLLEKRLQQVPTNRSCIAGVICGVGSHATVNDNGCGLRLVSVSWLAGGWWTDSWTDWRVALAVKTLAGWFWSSVSVASCSDALFLPYICFFCSFCPCSAAAGCPENQGLSLCLQHTLCAQHRVTCVPCIFRHLAVPLHHCNLLSCEPSKRKWIIPSSSARLLFLSTLICPPLRPRLTTKRDLFSCTNTNVPVRWGLLLCQNVFPLLQILIGPIFWTLIDFSLELPAKDQAFVSLWQKLGPNIVPLNPPTSTPIQSEVWRGLNWAS